MSTRTEYEPLITFHYNDEAGEHLELHIHHNLWHANTVSRVPYLFEVEEERCDFRKIVGVDAYTNGSREWEAFECFRTWLYTGIYNNKQIVGTHHDAYYLSETLRSPRFANAVMQKILAVIPSRKYDEDLKDTYLAIFHRCEPEAPLRRLYTQAAIFWNSSRISPFDSRDVLADLDPEIKTRLTRGIARFKDRICGCGLRLPPKVESRRTTRGDIIPSAMENLPGNTACLCQEAPWSRPNQFFVAT